MTPACAPFYFNIHNIVKGRVSGPERLMAPVIHELAHYRQNSTVNAEDQLDLIVGLDWLSAEKDNRSTDPGDVFHAIDPGAGNEAFAYSWQGRHLGARWRVELSGSNPMKLYFQGNFLSQYIVAKWIVEPAIRVVAEQKGAIMTHAAAVSDGEQALLIAGPGGAGKTTWVLHWLEAGHPFLSDDFSLIVNNQVLAYVTPLRLGARNLMVNKILEKMSATSKIQTAIRTVVRRALLGKVKFYFKAPVEQAIPGISISQKAALAGAILLDSPGSQASNSKPKAISPEEFSGLMTQVDRSEMHGFGAGIQEKDKKIINRKFWSGHNSKILSALSQKPCFSMPAHVFPPKEALASTDKLISWLENNL